MSTTLQTTLMHHFYPARVLGDAYLAAHPEVGAQVSAHAQQQVGALLGQIETQLARHGGDWLLPGDAPTVPDYYGLMLCRWTRSFQGEASPPARLRPGLRPGWSACWPCRPCSAPGRPRVWPHRSSDGEPRPYQPIALGSHSAICG
jgi:hypothetical protein